MRRCALALAALLAAACHRDMYEQPKLRPHEPSPLFADGSGSRPLVADTIPRAVPAGYDESAPPPAMSYPLIRRGRERFDIYCSPCHGLLGDGRGAIVLRGFPPPPSFHADRLRTAPDAHFFDVITNGFGAMYSYRDRVPAADRWAIVAYIRALQRSQHATVRDVPPKEALR